MFDAQFTPALAEQVIAAIQQSTDSPIRYVVVTHPNPDKFNGVGPFRALGARVVASETTAQALPGVHEYKKSYFVGPGMFSNETDPPLAEVDLVFSGRFEMLLDGDVQAILQQLEGPGVSSTQTVAHVPALSALFVGDLVHHGAHAWLEGGIVGGQPQPNVAAWQQTLDQLLAYEDATVYAGRGAPAPVAAAVAEQQRYLGQMESLIVTYLATLDDPAVSLAGANALDHHKSIATLAEQAFPNYEHSYLIEYGVYGLAQQLARESSR